MALVTLSLACFPTVFSVVSFTLSLRVPSSYLVLQVGRRLFVGWATEDTWCLGAIRGVCAPQFGDSVLSVELFFCLSLAFEFQADV